MTGRLQTNWDGVFFGVALGVLASFQMFKLPLTLPNFLGAFGYSKLLAGSLMSVYAVVGLLGSLWLGRAMTGKGAGGFLAVGVLMFVAGNLLALVGAKFGIMMLVSRALEGAAFTILAIAGGVIATANASSVHRPIAVALWATWIPAGQVVASLSALSMVSLGGWQALWFGAVLLTLVIALWGWRLSANDRSTLLIPASEAETDRRAAPHHAEKRAIFFTAGLFALWSCQVYAFMTWLPQFLVEVHGFNLGQAAWGYLLPPLMIIVFNLLAGVLLQAGVGLGLLLSVSLAIQAIVWFMVPVVGAGYDGLICLIMYGGATGITPTCIYALPAAITGNSMISSGTFGILMTGRNLGMLIGPVLLPLVIQTTVGWNVVAPLFGVISLMSLVVAGLAFQGKPDRTLFAISAKNVACDSVDS
jgi:predicted MFS family arabinose efflux permease